MGAAPPFRTPHATSGSELRGIKSKSVALEDNGAQTAALATAALGAVGVLARPLCTEGERWGEAPAPPRLPHHFWDILLRPHTPAEENDRGESDGENAIPPDPFVSENCGQWKACTRRKQAGYAGLKAAKAKERREVVEGGSDKEDKQKVSLKLTEKARSASKQDMQGLGGIDTEEQEPLKQLSREAGGPSVPPTSGGIELAFPLYFVSECTVSMEDKVVGQPRILRFFATAAQANQFAVKNYSGPGTNDGDSVLEEEESELEEEESELKTEENIQHVRKELLARTMVGELVDCCYDLYQNPRFLSPSDGSYRRIWVQKTQASQLEAKDFRRTEVAFLVRLQQATTKLESVSAELSALRPTVPHIERC